MLRVVALLAVLACAARAQNETKCDACTDETCVVEDNVRVQKLCADELCVQGQAVTVGDEDPCTSDDWFDGELVHVPIKDCCRMDADCAQWAPDVCHTSECVKEDEATHGVCVHEPIPGCCACDADCEERACQTATCVPTEGDGEVIFTKRKRDASEHHTRLSKRNVVMNAPGECQYEPVPEEDECCTESADCTECGPNTVPVCDVANECICVASTQFECTTDDECQGDEVQNGKCRAKGRCFDNVCDRGFCACKKDLDKDTDQDGVCCRDDCDDLDAELQDEIFCTAGNATEVNRDDDAFVACGTRVEPLCADECPDDRIEVPADAIDKSHLKYDEYFVRWDCDCCDANANDTLPDEEIVCAKDANGNGVFGPVDDEILDGGSPPGCYGPVCVLQIEGSHNKSPKNGGMGNGAPIGEAERDAQCAEALGGEDFVFVPIEEQVPDAGCDQCDDDPNAVDGVITANVDCSVAVEFGDELVVACSGADPVTGIDLDTCCTQLLAVPDDGTPVPPEWEQWRTCCQAIKDSEEQGGAGSFPAQDDVTGNECAAVDDALFPLELNTCGCTTTDETSPCEVYAECVFDKDYDGYYGCDDTEVRCFTELPHGIEGPFNPDDADQQDELCKYALGKNFHVAGLLKALNGGSLEMQGDGTFCDCNDKDKHVSGKIACLKDADGDGVPSCPLLCEEQSREPECAQVCAAYCPDGYLPLDSSLGDSDAPNCVVGGRKRSVNDLYENAAKNGWFDGGGKKGGRRKGGRRKGGYYDDYDDKSSSHSKPHKPITPRDDEECDESLECDVCDCCDVDPYVYEANDQLQSYASAEENACGEFDWNCNCENEVLVACPGSGTLIPAEDDTFEDPRAIVLFPVFDDPADTDPENDDLLLNLFFADPDDPPGSCDEECESSNGWLTEGEVPAEVRKRDLTIELDQPGCQQVVAVFTDGSDVVVRGDDDTEPRPFEYGDCAEWVEQCHLSGMKGDQTCTPDCEICTRIAI